MLHDEGPSGRHPLLDALRSMRTVPNVEGRWSVLHMIVFDKEFVVNPDVI